LAQIKGHAQIVNQVSWCPTDAHLFASCSDDGYVKIWSVDQVPKATISAQKVHKIDMLNDKNYRNTNNHEDFASSDDEDLDDDSDDDDDEDALMSNQDDEDEERKEGG